MYSYKYQRPAVAVDIVLFDTKEKVKTLLIQRKNDPFKGCWAFAGGFFEVGETVEDAALRELEEETSVKGIELTQLKVFSKPDRDPRGQVISVAFTGLIDSDLHKIEAKSDAKDVKWFDIDDLPELAFDHEEILKAALEKLNLK